MKIHIIDKHPILRKGLMLLLSESFSEIKFHESESVHEYLNREFSGPVDLLILGGKPGGDNLLEDIQELIGILGKIPILIYDECSSQHFAIPYLMAGVRGYIAKEKTAGQLVECINNILNGRISFHLPATEITFDTSSKPGLTTSSEWFAVVSKRLSPREYEVARLLGQGMKIVAIARYIGISASTVSNIKGTILAKLGLDNAYQLREML